MPNYHVDGERAFVSTSKPCPYDCEYCFAKDGSYNGFKPGSMDQLVESLKGLEKVTLIQLGCDTEFFTDEGEALSLIRALSTLGKDISFATKKILSHQALEELSQINAGMDNYLVAFVSVIGYETARQMEHLAPDPEERVQLIKDLHSHDLPTFTYIKPLHPRVPTSEIERLIADTQEYCDGHVVGMLICSDEYLKRQGLTSSKPFPTARWFPEEPNSIMHAVFDPRISDFQIRYSNFWPSSLVAVMSLRAR